jgi:hypothetical protein
VRDLDSLWLRAAVRSDSSQVSIGDVPSFPFFRIASQVHARENDNPALFCLKEYSIRKSPNSCAADLVMDGLETQRMIGNHFHG